MEPIKWKTAITKVEPNKIVTRGIPQDELIGTESFSHVVFLLIKGRLPNEREGKMMDAILTACVDHGVTPPSSQAARVVASGGVPMPTAIAAGLMSIGDFHGGAIEKGALYLQDGVKRMKEEGKEVEKMAAILVSESREKGERILGFGHRIHTDDPRTKRLLELADELEIAKDHVALSKAIAIELEKSLGKKLPINVDGCVAALISDMDFDWRLGKAFFLIGRCAGLTAQVYEEITREKPMRRMWSADVEYDGPSERNVD
jgi:citrate synthase